MTLKLIVREYKLLWEFSEMTIHFDEQSTSSFQFSVPNLNQICTMECDEKHFDCLSGCENDLSCISDCTREMTKCITGKSRFSRGSKLIIHNTSVIKNDLIRLSVQWKLSRRLCRMRKLYMSMRGKSVVFPLFYKLSQSLSSLNTKSEVSTCGAFMRTENSSTSDR